MKPFFKMTVFLLCLATCEPVLMAQVKTTKAMTTVSNMQMQKPAVVSYSGAITITPVLLQQMQQEWQTNAAQLGGSRIKVELWQADYQPDGKTGNSMIMLRQRINANIGYQFADNTLKYQATTAPVNGKLVLVAYCPVLRSLPTAKIKGKPDDGTGASITHQYKSNAKAVLGNNVIYGIYSVLPQQTNPASIDFGILLPNTNANCKTCFGLDDVWNYVQDAVKKTINGIEHTFDQTIDGIGDLAKCVAQDISGIGDATGFFINEAGAYFYETGAGLINLIQYGKMPSMRNITSEEYAWANSKIFNNTLPPINQIKIFNFLNLQGDHHRAFTWPAPVGNYIYVNIGPAFDNPMQWVDNINNAYLAPGQVFIHELTHAWQIGKYGLAGMAQKYFAYGGLNQTYDPGCNSNNLQSNFNFEQQATVVDRAYTKLYYPEIRENNQCDFEFPWVENNIRNGAKFDVAGITATMAMQRHAAQFSAYVGNVNNAAAAHTTGNGKDGDGYFMLGSVPWSVLYYNNKTKTAYANWGDIRKKYNSLNSEHGSLGWPEIDPVNLSGGAFQRFNHGHIYWTPKYGAVVVIPDIMDAWGKQNWEKGALGYPIADYVSNNQGNTKAMETLNMGGMQRFEHGFIELNITRGVNGQNNTTTAVHIYSKYEELGQATQTVQNAKMVTAATDSTAAGTKYNSVTPKQVAPGTVKPGNTKMINPQPLPPKVQAAPAIIKH